MYYYGKITYIDNDCGVVTANLLISANTYSDACTKIAVDYNDVEDIYLKELDEFVTLTLTPEATKLIEEDKFLTYDY